MLPENMPLCECGIRDYLPGGGMLAGPISTSQFSCKRCLRMSLYVYLYGYAAVLYVTEAATGTTAKEDESRPVFNYVNDVLISFARSQASNRREGGPRELLSMPPNLPADVTCKLLHTDGCWYPVDHELSAQVPMPVDPIRIRHDARWAKIHETLNLGDVPRTKNGYGEDKLNLEPWFKLELDNATIKYGPRKRVDSIEVSAKTLFDVTRISALGASDGVTYYDNFDNDADVSLSKRFASSLTIHAWTDEKFVEYMTAILDSLKNAKA